MFTVLGIAQGAHTRGRNLGDHLMKSPTYHTWSLFDDSLVPGKLLQADNLIGFCIFISFCVCVCVCVCLVAWSCPTLCNPMDPSPPGSSVHGMFQARILEWVAISYSRVSAQPRDQTQISCTSCITGGFFTC